MFGRDEDRRVNGSALFPYLGLAKRLLGTNAAATKLAARTTRAFLPHRLPPGGGMSFHNNDLYPDDLANDDNAANPDGPVPHDLHRAIRR